MKKIVLLVSVIASVLALTSCAKDNSANQAPAAAPTATTVTPAHHHHHRDYKGEVSSK